MFTEIVGTFGPIICVSSDLHWTARVFYILFVPIVWWNLWRRVIRRKLITHTWYSNFVCHSVKSTHRKKNIISSVSRNRPHKIFHFTLDFNIQCHKSDGLRNLICFFLWWMIYSLISFVTFYQIKTSLRLTDYTILLG